MLVNPRQYDGQHTGLETSGQDGRNLRPAQYGPSTFSSLPQVLQVSWDMRQAAQDRHRDGGGGEDRNQDGLQPLGQSKKNAGILTLAPGGLLWQIRGLSSGRGASMMRSLA